jgi:hypothetical protein
MKTSLLSLQSFFLTISVVAQSPLWGNLEKGRNDVGFKVIYTYDFARPTLADQNMKGVIVASPAAPARQMQISLWYPSKATGKKMTYGDYVAELAKEIDFSPFTQQRKDLAIEKVVNQIHDYQQNERFKREDLEKLLSVSMMAIRDSKSVAGRFPLLIFPHWFSPMDGSIMSEYLASQGFVVATTSLKGTDSVLPEISPRGLQTLASDIHFIINKLSEVEFVDVSKVAVMGVGINATGCITALKDNSSIDAFISLDGGIITESEMQMFHQTNNSSLTALAKPMLFINAPHPSVNPKIADFFKYADKYYLRFNGMSEYYFLNNGMIDSILPGIIGKAPGDVKLGFEWASRYVCQFLKYSLKDDAVAYTYLDNEPAKNGVAEGILEKSFKKGLPVPPSLHELKILCASEGAIGLHRIYDNLKIKDAQPFTQLVLADLFNWLGFRRDDDFSIRKVLVHIWLEAYPNSSRGHYMAGRLLTIQGTKDEAKIHYEKAIELLPLDEDIYLDNVMRKRIRNVSNEELKK